MFDKMQEKGLAYRREDLRFLPTLNCTRFISVAFSPFEMHNVLLGHLQSFSNAFNSLSIISAVLNHLRHSRSDNDNLE